MSRCFPFPPPGYEKANNTRDEAPLTESFKRERDRADKERRKEKKREKKERKKKEKEEKSKIKEEVEKKTQTNTDLKFIDYQKRKDYGIEQQLERSGLSEEHGQPNSVPKVCDSSDSTQNSGKRKRHNSPESQTQSTMFRIRLPLGKHRDPEEQPSKEQLSSSSRSTKHEDQELRSGGKVCSSGGDKHRNLENQLSREQLYSSARSANNHKGHKELPNTGKLCFLSSGSKPRDPEQFCREQPCSSSIGRRGLDEVVRREQLCSPPSGTKSKNLAELPGKEHFCSSSGKIVVTEKKVADNCPGPRTGTLNQKMVGIAPSSSIKQSCSIKGKAEVPSQDNSDYAAAVVKLGLCGSGSLSDVQLRNLIDNWVPPPIQAEPDFDDQEWLFDIPPRREPKRAKVIDVASCIERTSLWPRACYLPEAEIYALPYTVPF